MGGWSVRPRSTWATTATRPLTRCLPSKVRRSIRSNGPRSPARWSACSSRTSRTTGVFIGNRRWAIGTGCSTGRRCRGPPCSTLASLNRCGAEAANVCKGCRDRRVDAVVLCQRGGVLNVEIGHSYKLTSHCFKRGKISSLSRHLHF